ncbi:LOW QUALITY PROTEIN: colipase-like [Neoarius graeffei]|uniref:LOW QUALITY PROTEIN: colipase-like n=1 Tax=Neoarius graeffei TaxID=443677 RepID=UPI00298D5743|nr:LOW QUALITY PROTEIN: colipase-like [Neoarius graeffei]
MGGLIYRGGKKSRTCERNCGSRHNGMKAVLVIAMCLMALALATTHETSDERGIIINLNNGELCFISAQCKSSCCHRHSATSLARCAPRSAENEVCSKKSLYGTYYYCTCEDGLKCEGDWSVGGSIVNTNFGTCKDPHQVSNTSN